MSPSAQVQSSGPIEPSATWRHTWRTDGAWICGLAGALTVLICGYWFSAADALQQGIVLFDRKWTDNPIDSSLVALGLCASVMVGVELLRLYRHDKNGFFRIDPDLKRGHLLRFLRCGLSHYFLYLVLFTLAVAFYQAANEYGFDRHSPYYEPWFRFLDAAWTCYLWAGLPYVLVTRAIHYDPQADERDPAHLFGRVLWLGVSALPGVNKRRPSLTAADKKVALGILIKLFFTPLMTVFFCQQFAHLVSHFDYAFNTLPEIIRSGQYSHIRFNLDLFNAATAVLFSIDVAVAWCGYVTASRWLGNQIISAEPTVLGWLVCVICYPPLQQMPGLYFSIPSDQALLGLQQPWLVSTFLFMVLISYAVYVCATLCFGVRFSNLTNRGIIRRGPFAWVRHPAYASKNIAWWCAMFPFVIYSIPETGLGAAFFSTISLIFMTGLYYLRAITEERHLLADPCYQEYCRQVKYRFIPRVF